MRLHTPTATPEHSYNFIPNNPGAVRRPGFLYVTEQENPMTKTHSPRRWASLDEAGEYLGVSARTIRRMVSAGAVPAYRVGPRLVRVDLAEVDALARQLPTSRGDAA